MDTLKTLELLSMAAAGLASVRDLEGLAETLQAILLRVVHIEYMGVYFYDPETEKLRLYLASGFTEEERREAERTALDRHPGQVLRTGERVHIPDVLGAGVHKESVRQFVVRSRLFLPVHSDGRCIGTIGMASTELNYFSELHVAVLEFACQVAGVVYKNVKDNLALRRQLGQIRRQELDLQRLSCPVIEIWERVLALPLIGTLSAQRFALIAESVLAATVAKRAKAVIVDLTGVEILDEADTRYLVRLCRAIELLGSRCLLCGISPLIARNLTLTDDALLTLRTHSTLREALAAAMSW